MNIVTCFDALFLNSTMFQVLKCLPFSLSKEPSLIKGLDTDAPFCYILELYFFNTPLHSSPLIPNKSCKPTYTSHVILRWCTWNIELQVHSSEDTANIAKFNIRRRTQVGTPQGQKKIHTKMVDKSHGKSLLIN